MARVYEALMLARGSCPKTEEFLEAFEFAEVLEESNPADTGALPFPTFDDLLPVSSSYSDFVADDEAVVTAEDRSEAAEPAEIAAESDAPEVAAFVEVRAESEAEEPQSSESEPLTGDELVEAVVAAAAADCLAESEDVELDGASEEAKSDGAQAEGAATITAEPTPAEPKPTAVPSAPGLRPAPWREEFAQLAKVIAQARSTQRLQVLAVCGAARGDGASFVTHNLSLAMAEVGALRVARFEVGASTGAGLGVVRSSAGESFQIAICRTPVTNVSEITTPHGGVTLAELQRGCDTQALIELLRKRFDLVLLDLPAVTAEADAARFAAQADGVIIVAQPQPEGTSRSPVGEARVLLAEAKANILGVVLNHRRAGDGADVRQVA